MLGNTNPDVCYPVLSAGQGHLVALLHSLHSRRVLIRPLFFSSIGLFALISSLFLSPLYALEQSSTPYLDSLIKEAQKKKLHFKRRWLLLGHYRKGIMGNYKSEADDPGFFQSPTGKNDPESELIATLKSFFLAPERLDAKEEHPQCNFPARLKWLTSELHIDKTRLPQPDCSRLEGWIKKLNTGKVTLVFASFYMNNPASMFGHTLLRLDRKNSPPGTDLLNYGVNYAATLDTENALLYIFKGVFGFFKGRFSLFPYYMKVQKYNNWENRDIWEYELDFNEEQISYLLLHLWELGDIYFYYYYFDENCSYHILSVLEVANPELRLTNPFFYTVVPTETIEVMASHKGFIKKRTYRPSIKSVINDKRAHLDELETEIFERLVNEPDYIKSALFDALPVKKKAAAMDPYLDYSQLLLMKDPYSKRLKEINKYALLKRSQLGIKTRYQNKTRYSSPPDLGHSSDRVSLNTGFYDGQAFEGISYRPAYHDLLARHEGFDRYSQILFFDFNFRYLNDERRLQLEKFSLLNIISLSPYDPLFKKLSWKLDLGFEQIQRKNCANCNIYLADTGLGYSFTLNKLPCPSLFYLFADLKTEASSDLNDFFAVGTGTSYGIFLDITKNLKIHLWNRWLTFPGTNIPNHFTLSFDSLFALSKNSEVRLNLSRTFSKNTIKVSIGHYF